MSDLVPLFAQASSQPVDPIHAVYFAIVVPSFVIALVWIVAGAWTQIHRLRLESALKQQMIDRGMSADDILAVLNNGRPSEEAVGAPLDGEGAVDLPYACEAVVEIDDEWQTALILKREGERYFVHVVGTDTSNNQWVTRDRVRVPFGSEERFESPMDWSFPVGSLRTGSRCGRASSSKPAPVDQEV